MSIWRLWGIWMIEISDIWRLRNDSKVSEDEICMGRRRGGDRAAGLARLSGLQQLSVAADVTAWRQTLGALKQKSRPSSLFSVSDVDVAERDFTLPAAKRPCSHCITSGSRCFCPGCSDAAKRSILCRRRSESGDQICVWVSEQIKAYQAPEADYRIKSIKEKKSLWSRKLLLFSLSFAVCGAESFQAAQISNQNITIVGLQWKYQVKQREPGMKKQLRHNSDSLYSRLRHSSVMEDEELEARHHKWFWMEFKITTIGWFVITGNSSWADLMKRSNRHFRRFT